MGCLYAEPGDVGFAHGTGMLSRAIRWAERTKNEPPSWANHSLLFTTPGIVAPFQRSDTTCIPVNEQARVIEALWHIEHHHWFEHHKHEPGYRVKVYRPTFLGQGDRECIVKGAVKYAGQRYGWWKLLPHLARKLTGVNFPKLLFIDSRPICSYLVANAFDECGHPDAFGTKVPAQAQDPDDQADFCEWASYQGGMWKYIGEVEIP